MVAPTELSLLTNYAETQAYLGLLERNIQNRKFVYIDLSRVAKVTIDAILVMLALIRSGTTFQKGLPLVKGSCPNDASAQYLIFHSGFYEEIDRNFPKREPHQQKGVIRRKEGFKVQPEVAAEISKKAGKCVFGNDEYPPGLYTIFIEAMGNTKQHASPSAESKEKWWTLAYFDADKKTAKFAFYDSGVGILRSLRGRLSTWFAERTPFASKDEDILHDMMHGSNRSRTKIPYRGKGLPSMATALSRGQIDNMVILTNNTRGDVKTDVFERLPLEFNGTLLYWEMEQHAQD